MAKRIDFTMVRKMELVVVTGSIFCTKESVHELDTATYKTIIMITVLSSM